MSEKKVREPLKKTVTMTQTFEVKGPVADLVRFVEFLQTVTADINSLDQQTLIAHAEEFWERAGVLG